MGDVCLCGESAHCLWGLFWMWDVHGICHRGLRSREMGPLPMIPDTHLFWSSQAKAQVVREESWALQSRTQTLLSSGAAMKKATVFRYGYRVASGVERQIPGLWGFTGCGWDTGCVSSVWGLDSGDLPPFIQSLHSPATVRAKAPVVRDAKCVTSHKLRHSPI